MADATARLRESLRQQSASRSAAAAPGEFRFGFSLGMLQHAQSHKRIYQATVGRKSGAFVLQHMQE